MTPSGAVIDKHSGNALLAMAAAEGLVRVTRQTDGVFERICERQIDYHVREQLLEQLVLTPSLALADCPDLIWDALDGPLKADGHIVRLNDPRTELPDHVESISLDVIVGLVRAAGYNIPSDEFLSRAEDARRALDEEDESYRDRRRGIALTQATAAWA